MAKLSAATCGKTKRFGLPFIFEVVYITPIDRNGFLGGFVLQIFTA
jgi:hypothetical protein